ncbi:hypothetical protein T265_09300 [Opisthorchis viverrini]|uniref:Uncharacterized protein n=1 Tax=Opisthorchis viverrini TaxID=6198 RepID=A0A074Z6J4_OPIVI|nr:hypothetical protein T265_09300 [Opisthorchis viverrini]KER22678.1 hypothetical protein T265_09300 [Opisthorchis viverrini]
MPPEGSTRAGILSGCPSLDRGSREAEAGFELRTFRPVNSRTNHLGHLAPATEDKLSREGKLEQWSKLRWSLPSSWMGTPRRAISMARDIIRHGPVAPSMAHLLLQPQPPLDSPLTVLDLCTNLLARACNAQLPTPPPKSLVSETAAATPNVRRVRGRSIKQYGSHRPVYLTTFNVRTLKRAAQQVALARALDSLCIDVCCLSETRTQVTSTVIELTVRSLSQVPAADLW